MIKKPRGAKEPHRVRLVKTLAPEELPIGTLGTVLEGSMCRRGMLLIRFDIGCIIPMYRHELERVPR